MSGNYPAGVTDSDPHFDLPSVGDDDVDEYERQPGSRLGRCPFCGTNDPCTCCVDEDGDIDW